MDNDEENTVDDTALVPLRAARGDAIGEALKEVYSAIPGDIVGFVENHRIQATNGYLEHMKEIRNALAPFGAFRDWCAAAGVNYGTISKALSRRFGEVMPDTRESHSKLPSDAASDARLLEGAARLTGPTSRSRRWNTSQAGR
jgi:hypothetical protein